MKVKTEFPSTFFVDVFVPGCSFPFREQVRFKPGFGLVFNARFSNRYSYLADLRGAFVDRRSHRVLQFYESVGFRYGRSLPILQPVLIGAGSGSRRPPDNQRSTLN